MERMKTRAPMVIFRVRANARNAEKTVCIFGLNMVLG